MVAALTPEFALHPDLQPGLLTDTYARAGRLHLPGLLSLETAEALHAHLRARTDWQLIFNHGDQLYELSRAQQAELGATRLAELVRAAQNSGRDRFQYLYENIRVSDNPSERRATNSMLDRFVDFLNGSTFLQLARTITGRSDISFADGQATCYRGGHFLNTHDDDVAGKNRIAAYVVSLSPTWRPEWGGQLQFVSAAGHISAAYVPKFNALNLLRVPQPHLVSCVTPLAPTERYSITGWLRCGTVPAS